MKIATISILPFFGSAIAFVFEKGHIALGLLESSRKLFGGVMTRIVERGS